jgi:hypothetical protein
MKIQGNVLFDVINKDIVDGTFIIPDSVEWIRWRAFENCTSLKEIIIPDSVVLIRNWAFYRCTSLKEVIVSDSVKSIQHWAFENCTSLESITITNPNTKFGIDVFKRCHNLANIIAPEHIKKEIEWQEVLARFAQPNEKIAQKLKEWKTKLQ